MIKVTEKYCIDVDDRQYIVQQHTVVKSGKNEGDVNYINQTYHATMTEALTNVIRRIQKDKLKTDEIIYLKDAIKILIDVQKEFTDIAKGIEVVGSES